MMTEHRTPIVTENDKRKVRYRGRAKVIALRLVVVFWGQWTMVLVTRF